MDKYTSDCIAAAKKIIREQLEKDRIYGVNPQFSEYSKFYFFTNERIADYLSACELENKDKALSVLASGDHPFNLIAKGVMNIDTFDSNKLTEYYALGLKRAMLLKYNYDRFIEIYCKLDFSYKTSLEEECDLISELLPEMDKKYREFWRELISYNYKLQRNEFENIPLHLLLEAEYFKLGWILPYNAYLQSEEDYDAFRSKLAKANITFKYANATSLHNEFAGPYDIILLSNILDYFDNYWGYDWAYEKLKEYEDSLERMMNPGSYLFLTYGWTDIFNGSLVSESNLKDEKVIRLPDDHFVVLKRVKGDGKNDIK